MSAPALSFWFEFASPYSWLSAMRIAPLARAAGVSVAWRPFLLGPIFAAQGWADSPFNALPAKGRHMWIDVARQAQKYGLGPLTVPDPFPQHSLLAARVATLGAGQGWLPDFARAVFTAEFTQARAIAEPAVLAALLDALGQDGAALAAQAGSDQANKDALRAATEAAIALGVFGAPSFTADDGALFWGDDRLEDALAHAAASARTP